MPPTEPQVAKKSNGLIISIIALVIIVAIIFVVVKASSKPAVPVVTTPSDTTGTSTLPIIDPKPTSGTTTPTADLYKDGTYSADGHYTSPGGHQTVHVTLTLANDIVTAVTVTPGNVDPTSGHYQSLFISGVQAAVVGKDISTLNLTKVSGSSLTPGGFDNAVAQIKTQAQA